MENRLFENSEESKAEIWQKFLLDTSRSLSCNSSKYLLELVDDVELNVRQRSCGDILGEILSDHGSQENLEVDICVYSANGLGDRNDIVVYSQHPLSLLIGVEKRGLDVECVGLADGLSSCDSSIVIWLKVVENCVVSYKITRQFVPFSANH